MVLWPPQLEDARRELKRTATDVADDLLLQNRLDAAVSYVEERRAGEFDFGGMAASPPLPGPTPHLWQGTVELAIRWYIRMSSPDGLVNAGDGLGAVRIPATDADIEQKLGIGRWRGPMVG